MKRDKFKKMRLWLETLKPAKAGDCALLLQGLTMETSETSNFSMESVEQKKRELKNGILAVEMEARGIRTDDKRLAHLKTERQAEILDYNYFKSRMPEMVITDIQAEVFDFRKKRVVPFAVKRLEFSFGNGKKVDMTDRVNVLSRDCLAGLGKGNFYGEGCKTAGKEKCSCDGGSPVSGEDWGRGLLSLWGQSVVDRPGEKDS